MRSEKLKFRTGRVLTLGCPVCNYSKIVTNGRKDDLVNQCQNCRLFFTPNYENKIDIKKYYEKDYV